MIDNDILGLLEEDAIMVLNSFSVPYRIVCRDTERYIVTMDFRVERLNLTLENGVVTRVTRG